MKIDTRSPPSRSYETAKMIGTEEFFSASWQADKTSATPLQWHRPRQREPNFRADENSRRARRDSLFPSFSSDENSGYFETMITSGLIKNRLLFCRKCPMKFGPCGVFAQMQWIITEFTIFNGTMRSVKVLNSLQFNPHFICIFYIYGGKRNDKSKRNYKNKNLRSVVKLRKNAFII